jgi:hypothetical protein
MGQLNAIIVCLDVDDEVTNVAFFIPDAPDK